MTDRLTDGPRYSICSNRLHLASAAMWPNNKTQQPIRHPFMQDNSSEQVPEKNTLIHSLSLMVLFGMFKIYSDAAL